MEFKTEPMYNALGKADMVRITDADGKDVAIVNAIEASEVAEWLVGLMNAAQEAPDA